MNEGGKGMRNMGIEREKGDGILAVLAMVFASLLAASWLD